MSRTLKTLAPVAGLLVVLGASASMQPRSLGYNTPTNDLPNPYQTVENYFKLPAGRTWGSTSAIDVDRDGRSIWVGERCGANSCLDRASGQMSPLPSVLKFSAAGDLVASFGAGLIIFPHGMHVDRDGNVWVTDGQDNAPTPARGTPPAGGAARGAAPIGAAPAGGAARGTPPAGGAPAAGRGPARIGPLPGATIGHQVFKFSPDGRLLLTLGKPGGAGAPDYFHQPNDVITNAAGEIFVSEGHGQGNARILKFSRDGKLLKTWGSLGDGPGQFNQPHSLAFDSRGRLFVADRANNRIQIFDQEGTLLDTWHQFSRLSGIYIDRNDILYGADSESNTGRNHGEWRRGIRVGNVKDGKVTAFIPDPADANTGPMSGTSAAEGVVVDSQGNIFGAEVGPRAVKRYVRR